MNKTKFIFGDREFYEPPKPFENELFNLNVRGVLLVVIFKTGREKLFIDLSKLVRIEPSEHDPNWLCIYVIGKRDGRIKELQFDCGGQAFETKEIIIRYHKESTKCQSIETSSVLRYNSYGWGATQPPLTTFGGNLRVWKHTCYLCAREAETKNPMLKTHPRIDSDIENQINEFRTTINHGFGIDCNNYPSSFKSLFFLKMTKFMYQQELGDMNFV